MNKKFALAIVCVLILVLQACSNTPPTPISEPTETAIRAILTLTPTSTPTPTLTPTSTPTPIPLAWQQVFDGQEFERDIVTSFATDKQNPDVIYAAMKNSGVYKTIDGGLSWQPVLHGLTAKQVESLLIDSQNSHILYAGTIGGVFKTKDGGENWFRISDGTYLLMDMQNNSHLYARDENGIYETTDQGNNWITVYTLRKGCPDEILSWVLQPTNGDILFIGGGSKCVGVYQSNNNGSNWILIGLEDIPDINAIAIGLNKQGNYTIYAINSRAENWDSREGYMYTTHDGGANWSYTSVSNSCDILTPDPENPSLIYCASGTALFFIRGEGYNWEAIPGTQSTIYSAVHVDHPNGTNRIIAGGRTLARDHFRDRPGIGIFISEDGGVSWVERDNGLGSARAELKIDPLDSARIYLATYYAGKHTPIECTLYRSLDHGKSWLPIQVDPGWCGPAFDSANVFYLIEVGALQKSWDGGEKWLWVRTGNEGTTEYNKMIANRLPGWDRGTSFESISANPYTIGLIYAVGDTIYYSIDTGYNWQPSKGSKGSWDGKLFYTDQSKMIYTIGRYHQTYSTDNGKTWQNCGEDVTTSRSDTRLALDLQGSRLYLATPGQGVLISTDECQSWQPSNEGLSNLFVNTLAIDPNNSDIIYAGTDGGAYISYDAGATWGQVNDGLLGATVVYSIAIDSEGNVYAATPYGIFKLEGK